jgi:succinylglutamic semialdehyde dehydrogenase
MHYKGSYIEGQFLQVTKSDEEWTIHSPADLEDHVLTVKAEYSHIDAAIDSAKQAFKKWKWTPLVERMNLLHRLKEIYQGKKEQIAEIISRETGKPYWEALGEAQALVAKIDVTLNYSLKLVEEQRIENALPGIDGYIRFKPRGVMSVIGPFNFPAHLPNGHIIPALITGNTVVFKPSDKTPGVGQIMAECFDEAGFPAGVFNLIQGQGEVGKRLVTHEFVDGVLFTGSYDVGLKIKQDTLRHHWKILALEMGGKNCSIVWNDADLKKAVYENLMGAFLTSGQRCSCTSKIILHKDIKDEFIDKFYQNSKKLTIGHWKSDSFMGPVISEQTVDNYVRFQEIAKREGAECLMRGKSLELEYKGHYVTPSIYLVKDFDPKSIYQKSEIFAPNVAIYVVDSLEQAIEINNSTGFGLVTSIFTQEKQLYEKILLESKVGLVNWNRTTNGASSKLPFGGMGKSGNDRPSAHFAVNYCTVPVSSLEDKAEFDETSLNNKINYIY